MKFGIKPDCGSDDDHQLRSVDTLNLDLQLGQISGVWETTELMGGWSGALYGGAVGRIAGVSITGFW